MTDELIICVSGQTIMDALSLTKREGIPSSPVALLALKAFRYFKTLLSETTKKNSYSASHLYYGKSYLQTFFQIY